MKKDVVLDLETRLYLKAIRDELRKLNKNLKAIVKTKGK